MAALPSVLPFAIESGAWIRDPGRRWAFLDVVKGNWPDPRFSDVRGGCPRWPETWWLVNRATGEASQGRCKATNLCSYCRDAYLRETAAVLRLECEARVPTVYLVLTAREHLTRAACKHPLEMIRRWFRKHWPACEWFVTVELQKRGALHLNLLLRGVPAHDAPRVQVIASREWCGRVDALPVAQRAESIWDADGVAAYVAKFETYVTKADQQPRVGWTGHRTSQTRGFFPEGMKAMRARVRSHLVWRVHYAHALDLGLRGLAASSWATNRRAIEALAGWSLVDVAGPHAPRPAQRSGNEPVSERASDRASASPAASVKGYVNDQRRHGRLFDPYAVPARKDGPQSVRS